MFYHAWLRVEGGWQSWSNRTLGAIVAEVVVPFAQGQCCLVAYHDGHAWLNFAASVYLRIFRSEQRCDPSELDCQFPGDGNPAIEDCTEEVLRHSSEHLGDYLRTERGQSGEVTQIDHSDAATVSRSTAVEDGAAFLLGGRMPTHEQGADEVCSMLADAKSRVESKRWTAEPAEHVADDGCLRCGDNAVSVQVTRVGPTERWADAARIGTSTGTVGTSEAADEIWDAIARKIGRRGQRATGSILAVSARQPAMHGFGRTVSEFRAKHGAKLQAQATFAEVWLVGYTTDTTHRVYP